MNPPPLSEKVDTQETAPCRSKGTIRDRWAAGLDSAQQLCATRALPGPWGCWGPGAAQGSGGHSKHTLPVPPPSEVGAAAHNPSIERMLIPAHLRLPEPVADKDNVS